MKSYSFGKTEIGYLGFWVTQKGVKPISRKIEAITNMKPPNFLIGVHKFIGVINYYRKIWQRRSYTLAPLTRSKYIQRKFKRTQSEQDAIDKTKRIVAHDTLLTYLDFNET